MFIVDLISTSNNTVMFVVDLISTSNLSAPSTHAPSPHATSSSQVRSFDVHEDSVYSTSWSASDAWIFASLSYDGRVAINRVPDSEKYKILL